MNEVLDETGGVSPGLEVRAPRGILVADDQDFFRDSLCEALRRSLENVVVFSLPDGVGVARLMAEEKIDLVVTDLQMPKVDGVSLLMELREGGFAGPVLVLSGHLTGELQQMVMELGAHSFVEKPVDLDEVVKLCEEALETAERGIRGLSASGVAQLFALEEKTGTLRVSNSEGQGELFFRSGRLVFALTGSQTGEDAAMEILVWEGVELQILDIIPTFANEIQRSLQTLLLESAKELDESQRVELVGGEEEVQEEASSQELETAESGFDIGEAITSVSAPLQRTHSQRTHSQRTHSQRTHSRRALPEGVLSELIRLTGAIKVAIVTLDGNVLAQQGRPFNNGVEYGDRSTVEKVLGTVSAAGSLAPGARVEDVSISVANRFHIVKALAPGSQCGGNAFLYLVLDQRRSDLDLAKRSLELAAEKLS